MGRGATHSGLQTTQGSAWCAGISLTGILLMAAVAHYGFYTSLAQQDSISIWLQGWRIENGNGTPHEEQKQTLSEDTAPHLEQVTIGRIVSHCQARQ